VTPPKKYLGNVTFACKGVKTSKKEGIGRTTFYNWIRNDEAFRGLIRGIDLELGDYAQEALLRAGIYEKNMQALIFYLKHRHLEYR
jgi:hypothetical protein